MSDHHSEFYTGYIESEQWAKRRAEYYRLHPKRCRGCYFNKFIHLHHHTYERLGHELDEDLIPLCRRCHEQLHAYHDLHKGKQSLTVSTLQWLVKRNPQLKKKPTPRPKSPSKPPSIKKKVRKRALRIARKNRDREAIRKIELMPVKD